MAGFPNPVMGNDSAQDRASVDKGGQDNTTSVATPLAAAGGSPTLVSVVGSNDLRGQLTLTAGTVPAAGAIIQVTFAKSFDAVPVVIVTGRGVNSPGLGGICATAATPTGFQITVQNAPVAASVYGFNYLVIP